MIKSVTVKNNSGKLLFKILCRRDGTYDLIEENSLENSINIEVRNEKNEKIVFGGTR